MKRIRKQLKGRIFLAIVLTALMLALGFNLTRIDFSLSKQHVAGLQSNIAHLPLAFEPNQGQAANDVQFLVHHGKATTYFAHADTITTIGDAHVTMSLDGAAAPVFTGTDELSSKTNYFIGNDQSTWQKNVPNYRGIVASNVYPGIDLKYYGTNSQLEHDFIVSPNADPTQITFQFHGQDTQSLDSYGNLLLKLRDSEMTLRAPVSYQVLGGERTAVTSSFTIDEHDHVTIALGTYDRAQPLIIDPTLVYSSYLGGSGSDFGRGITVDAGGNVYLTGQTASSDFPLSNEYQTTFGGVDDAFITKVDPTGTSLIYSTYLGGSGLDQSMGIVTDSGNNVYVTGHTDSTDFPTSTPLQPANAGGEDSFITELDASGSTLLYSTYLGGTGQDNARAIALDSSNNAYVTGTTNSTDFPTASAFQATSSGSQEGFLTKLDSSGTTLMYSTYLGGTGDDYGFGIKVSASNEPYIIGFTTSTDLPTASPYQATNAGGFDAFVTRVDSSGLSLTWSTYLGGTGTDFGRGIDIDSSGNVYLIGITDSTNFPTASPFQPTNTGGFDSFVTKLNAGGSPTYSTYLGGSADDQGLAITVDASGQAYIAGLTGSTNFPTILPYQSTLAGADDIFASKINAAGSSMTYSTYIGGTGEDYSLGIALGPSGNAYLTGLTDSTDLPTAAPLQATNAGSNDAFLIQLADQPVVVTGIATEVLNFSISSTVCDFGRFSTTETKYCTHTMTAATNAANGYVISYIPTTTLTSGVNTITAMASQTASVVGSEQLGLNLKANTSAGSFTAANFGTNPSGGSGTAMTGYNTSDLFKFAVGGANIAESTIATNSTLYTASFIANIANTTEAGIYTTPITYNIVPSF